MKSTLARRHGPAPYCRPENFDRRKGPSVVDAGPGLVRRIGEGSTRVDELSRLAATTTRNAQQLAPRAAATGPHENWGQNGRRFRTLNVIDEGNCEAKLIEVGISRPSAQLMRALDWLIDGYGATDSIRMDNGPKMTSHGFMD